MFGEKAGIPIRKFLAKASSAGAAALLCLCLLASQVLSQPQERGGFNSTGKLARPSGGVADTEGLLVIYEPVGRKLLPTRKIGPRVYCSADCSVRATIKLDLPGNRDPKAAIFTSNLTASHIYTATISPMAADRARLVKSLSASKLVVALTATDQSERTDTDKRVFRFRLAG